MLKVNVAASPLKIFSQTPNIIPRNSFQLRNNHTSAENYKKNMLRNSDNNIGISNSLHKSPLHEIKEEHESNIKKFNNNFANDLKKSPFDLNDSNHIKENKVKTIILQKENTKNFPKSSILKKKKSDNQILIPENNTQ